MFEVSGGLLLFISLAVLGPSSCLVLDALVLRSHHTRRTSGTEWILIVGGADVLIAATALAAVLKVGQTIVAILACVAAALSIMAVVGYAVFLWTAAKTLRRTQQDVREVRPDDGPEGNRSG